MKSLLFIFGILFSFLQISGDEILVDATADEILKEISAYQGEKPVLVNFWATWCAPCIEEFPYIMDLHKQYEGDFKLIFVSGDFEEARDEAEAFLRKQGVDFTTYFKVGKDNDFITKISDNWSGALPFTIIYDKNGHVSSAWEGKADYQKFETELMNVLTK
ncbi:MAG: TlpA family protein disulfide reductase [Balneolaceae bacterium]|nr:TlpA family protein disulfide reductase [Balneolaceae bacterium]